jgi:hypothetical protein
VHRTHGRECRAHRTLGVILVGPWDAECGHDRVTGELLDRPAVFLDAARDAFEVAGHAAANDLRIDRCHELSGID